MTTRRQPTLGRRQYLIGPTRGKAPADFRSRPWGRLQLQWSPDLPSLFVEGPGGVPRGLLGIVADARGAGPARSLREQSSEELMCSIRAWEGRWLLLDGDWLHTDAFGTLPALRGGGFVSSTSALLPGGDRVPAPLSRHSQLSFYPGPATGIPGITRVMPSQRLDLEADRLDRRPLPQPVVAPADQAPALVDKLGEILLSTVRAAAETGPVKLPLTGGYDSRLLLAACVHEGVSPTCITQHYPDISEHDLTLPAEMCLRLGLDYQIVHPAARDPRLGALYDEQTGGLVAETDRLFLEHGQFSWLDPGDSLLRGVMFDGTREFNDITYELSLPLLERAFSPTKAQLEGLAQWMEIVEADQQPVNAHDRFWLEQRVGSYRPTSEVALDLLGAHSWMPGSSWDYQETALSLPLDWRVASRHHEMLVSRWAPEIADLPYNPPLPPWKRWRRIPGAARRRAAKLRSRSRQRLRERALRF